VINWAARKSNLLCSPAIYELLPPEQRRQLIRDCLRLQLPILQPQARAELDKALAALGIGGTEPLLKQAKTRRRRASPARIIEAEYGVMKWIAWQYGLGRKKKDVEADVASALGCTSALFAKWKAELAKIFGHNHVHDALAEAEQLGRFEAAGGVPSVRESDQESFIRRFTNCTLERDLAVLVSRFREGAQKRRMPQGDAARAAPRDRGRKPPH
jgi:hypothetical protein